MSGPSDILKHHHAIFAAVGELIYEWNNLEHVTRNLILRLVGRTAAAQILTANLGSVPLCEALRTIGNELTKQPVQDRIINAVQYIERLREYRNFYIHGFMFIAFQFENEQDMLNANFGAAKPIGVLDSFSAKSRYSRSELDFAIEDVQTVVSWCKSGRRYVGNIMGFVRDSKVPPPARPPQSLPEMLPLPDKLKKLHRYPLDEARPLRS
jgi:hypothetical protein